MRRSGSVGPASLLHFFYLDEFLADWKTLFPTDDDEVSLHELEMRLMRDPTSAPIVSGTGGLRKLRFALEGSDRGARGGIRVCYSFFPEHHIVLMVMAYPKNRQDNLSGHEKQGIKAYLEQTKRWLDQHL